jgi:hypothetical protein
MATLVERAIGAARLDAATYEEIEADESALPQATAVVAAAAIAAGIGANQEGGAGALLGVLASLLAWYIWAGVTYLIGTRLLPEPTTKADFKEVLRVIGFSAAPGVLAIAGIVPGVGTMIAVVASLWQLATMVVALRQALDYSSTGRAVAVCLIGFLVYLGAFLILVGGAAALIMMTGSGTTS